MNKIKFDYNENEYLNKFTYPNLNNNTINDTISNTKNSSQNSPKIAFDYHKLPNAYLADNPNADELRKQLIKNETKICDLGKLETIFFSDENIEIINKKIILDVYYLSNKQFKINHQKKETLIIVMRYIFIEFSRHLPYNIDKQIKELNYLVIKEVLPDIMTNITQNITYLNSIVEPRKLVQLPVNTTKNKTLLPPSSIYF